MLQTGGGDHTLVGRHVVSLFFEMYPVLQEKETDSSALYICFAVFENRPLTTVGELHASETCYIFKHPSVLCIEFRALVHFFSSLFIYILIKTY